MRIILSGLLVLAVVLGVYFLKPSKQTSLPELPKVAATITRQAEQVAQVNSRCDGVKKSLAEVCAGADISKCQLEKSEKVQSALGMLSSLPAVLPEYFMAMDKIRNVVTPTREEVRKLNMLARQDCSAEVRNLIWQTLGKSAKIETKQQQQVV